MILTEGYWEDEPLLLQAVQHHVMVCGRVALRSRSFSSNLELDQCWLD